MKARWRQHLSFISLWAWKNVEGVELSQSVYNTERMSQEWKELVYSFTHLVFEQPICGSARRAAAPKASIDRAGAARTAVITSTTAFRSCE